MTFKQALQRIEALEAKVRELEARPATVIHYHYHQEVPVYPSFAPSYPYRLESFCSSSGIGALE